jgi:hypothetical protein
MQKTFLTFDDNHDKAIGFLPYSWYAENITESEGRCRKE